MASDRVRSRRFVVDLGDIEISESVAKRIEDGIQRATLEALADQRNDRGKTYAFRFPIDWPGFLLRQRLPGLDEQFDGLEKEIGQQVLGR